MNDAIRIWRTQTWRLKEKKEVFVNEVFAQQNKSTRNSYGQQQIQNQSNKVGPIVYQCFICNSLEHKIYDYPHHQVTQNMLKDKGTTIESNKMN
jgi:hypothetical protein